ncbi:hypothetical protein BT96DRAFT_951566 [Gymnopus androsaceus JB14]|uniref:Uncharacterized protein n=1 Tax=Gymnopus androsaceus JB14 TaxID=1447944 RepID=A0A6A4GCG0_9AGAR|nr:hypothetical protein BT96DRAFT_951566 [Gymnopus androsaceus JB14]
MTKLIHHVIGAGYNGKRVAENLEEEELLKPMRIRKSRTEGSGAEGDFIWDIKAQLSTAEEASGLECEADKILLLAMFRSLCEEVNLLIGRRKAETFEREAEDNAVNKAQAQEKMRKRGMVEKEQEWEREGEGEITREKERQPKEAREQADVEKAKTESCCFYDINDETQYPPVAQSPRNPQNPNANSLRICFEIDIDFISSYRRPWLSSYPHPRSHFRIWTSHQLRLIVSTRMCFCPPMFGVAHAHAHARVHTRTLLMLRVLVQILHCPRYVTHSPVEPFNPPPTTHLQLLKPQHLLVLPQGLPRPDAHVDVPSVDVDCDEDVAECWDWRGYGYGGWISIRERMLSSLISPSLAYRLLTRLAIDRPFLFVVPFLIYFP